MLRSYAAGEHSDDDVVTGAVIEAKDTLPFTCRVQDTVVEVTSDCVRLASGAEVRGYDYLIIATGSRHVMRTRATTAAAARQAYVEDHARLKICKHALVVGSGPVGVEMVGELGHFMPQLKVSMATRSELLIGGDPFPFLHRRLEKKMHDVTPSLTIHYKTPVDIPSESEWRKQGFTFLPEPIAIAGFDDVDVVINGAATRFGCGFVSVGEKDEKDCVRVNTHFQIEGFPTVFCIGDAAASKYKLAFLAKWQGDAVAKNILRMHRGRTPTATVADKAAALLVPVGPRKGAGAIAMIPLVPTFGVGNCLTRMIKGKDLMAAQVRAQYSKASWKDGRERAAARAALNRMTNGAELTVLNA